jgi:hypothetical protein
MKPVEFYKELAKKYNVPIEVAQKICESQFAFCKEIISQGNDEPIRLQYLGKFHVKPGRREIVKKKREILKRNKDGKKES